MTFIYVPWDLLFKPMDRWEEVWFGFTIRGWSAKVSEIAHWLIYGAGSYGLWKMKGWLWPWITLYTAQVAVAMLIFNILAGPGTGDGRGGGMIVGIVIFLIFAYLTYLTHKARDLAD